MDVVLLDIDTWKQEVTSFDKATFFHYPEWYTIWEKHLGHSFECHLFVMDNDKRAILPISKTDTLIRGKSYWVSSPQGTYGGMVANSLLTTQEVSKILAYIKKRYPTFTLFSHPFATLSDKQWKNRTTQMIKLDSTWSEIESSMKKARIRSKLKVANENNLRIERMSKKDITKYFTIYQSLRQHWDNPTNNYDLSLFESMYGVNGIDFWGLYTEDVLIGGGLFMKHKQIHVSSWLPVCDRAYTNINANLFLYYTLIKYYKEQNFQYFDFNPSGGHEGVHAFKKKLGAAEYTYYEYEKLPLITSISNRIRGYH